MVRILKRALVDNPNEAGSMVRILKRALVENPNEAGTMVRILKRAVVQNPNEAGTMVRILKRALVENPNEAGTMVRILKRALVENSNEAGTMVRILKRALVDGSSPTETATMVRILKRALLQGGGGQNFIRVSCKQSRDGRFFYRGQVFLCTDFLKLSPSEAAGAAGPTKSELMSKRNLFLRTSRTYDDDRFTVDEIGDDYETGDDGGGRYGSLFDKRALASAPESASKLVAAASPYDNGWWTLQEVRSAKEYK